MISLFVFHLIDKLILINNAIIVSKKDMYRFLKNLRPDKSCCIFSKFEIPSLI